jgi:hypothetical protein
MPEAYQSKTVRHGPNCSRETIGWRNRLCIEQESQPPDIALA